jgi:hypothetical protein
VRPGRRRAALRRSIGLGGPLLVAAALALPAPAGAVTSPAPNPLVDTINGPVTAVARSGSLTFVGGAFTRIGIPTPDGAQFSLADGSSSAQFARPDGAVSAVVGDGAGGWYVGGSFTAVGGVTRDDLAHLLPNGSVDPSFDPNVNGNALALAISANRSTL